MLNDKAVTQWLEGITSERTKENYLREIPKFLDFVKANTEYKTPSQIIESRHKQLRSEDVREVRYWESIVVKYALSLNETDYSLNTKVTLLRTVLSFFAHHHAWLKYARKELFGKLTPSEKDKVIKSWIPKNEDVRLLYRMARDSRDRAILLTLYQSGFSEVDVASMKIEDFSFYDKDGNWKPKLGEHLYHARLREKTNILQQSVISCECLEEIRIMLQNRGFPKKGYLFVSFRNQPLGSRGLNDAVKSIVERAFDGRIKEWETKNLRDSFMNALQQANVQQDVKNAMCGHVRQSARKDYDLSEETILMMYQQAFKFLTINGFGSQSRKIEELEKQFTEQLKAMAETITELRNRLAENTESINKIEKKIGLKQTVKID